VLIFRPFALSLLTKTPTPNLAAYTWRRVLRIFPGYWVLALVVLLTIDHKYVSGLWYILRVVTMQHVYAVGAIPFGMEQTWSMATDTAFYLLVPLVAWLCAKMTKNVTDTATKAKLMLIPMAAIIAFGYAFDAWAHQPAFGPWAIQGNFPPVWFSYFIIGMILATLSAVAEVSPGRFVGWYRLAASKPLLCWGLAAGVTLAYCFSPMGDQGTVNYPSMGMELFNTPIDLLIVALVMAPLTVPHVRSRLIKTVLTWRPLVFVAKVSYGVYLWHIAVIYWLLGGLIGQHNLVFSEVIVIGASVVLATISFYLVERPAQKLRIRLGKASREPSVAVLETTA
jgi:peptidoglycan/LPS O-acetylase OafA/YrhL